MKYTVHSQMMMELPPSLPRFVRGVLLPICYLGALVAPTVVLGMVFQFFHSTEVSPFMFWPTTILFGGVAILLLYRTGSCAIQSFWQGVIHVESIVLFAATLLAVLVIPWVGRTAP